jgi:hypothetical protein
LIELGLHLHRDPMAVLGLDPDQQDAAVNHLQDTERHMVDGIAPALPLRRRQSRRRVAPEIGVGHRFVGAASLVPGVQCSLQLVQRGRFRRAAFHRLRLRQILVPE